MRNIFKTCLIGLLFTFSTLHAQQSNTNKRINAYQQSLIEAKIKIVEFKNVLKSKDPQKIKKITLEIQSDPAAIKELNKEITFVKKKYVDHIEMIQSETIKNIQKKVAIDYGVKLEDVRIKNFTNPSSKIKAGHDWDVTVSIKAQGEMSLENAKHIVHESYFKASGGKKIYPNINPKEFSEIHHVEVTNKTHAEAYEGGKKFIDNPTDYLIKDPEKLAKTIEHKSHLDQNNAIKHTQAGEYGKAEIYRHEQARQYTKQYKNIIEPRVKELGGIIPKNVEKGTKILDMIGKPIPGTDNTIFTPKDAEIALTKIGETPESIISKGSSLVESAQKFKTIQKSISSKYKKMGKQSLKIISNIMIVMDILNTGKTLEELYEGKISASEAVEVTVDRFSGGAISTPKLLLNKHIMYKDTLRLNMKRFKSNNKSRVLQIGILLRKNGVSKNKANDIMTDIRQGNEKSLQEEIHKLSKLGHKIKIPQKPTLTMNELLPTSDDTLSQRTIMVGNSIYQESKRAAKYIQDAFVNRKMTKKELWETLRDITDKMKQAKYYTGKLINEKSAEFFEATKGLWNEEGASTEFIKQQLHNLTIENLSQWQDFIREEKIANSKVFLQEQADKEWAMEMKMKLFKQGASPKVADNAVSQWIQGNKRPMALLRDSLRAQKRDLYIRLFVFIDNVRSTNTINNGIIHLKNGTHNKAAHKIKPGIYKFSDVKPDKYTASIQAEGYKARSGSSLLSIDLIVPNVEKDMKPQPIIKTLYMVPNPLQVTIEVVDDQGNVLPDANIALRGSNWRSGKIHSIDSSGKFVLKDVPLGKYQISATAPGYQPLKDGSTISIDASNGKVVKKIKLIPFLSNVNITVTDTFDKPVKDAKITFGTNNSEITDSQGKLTFLSVRPGNNLKALTKKDGYASVSTSIDVIPTQEKEEFTLKVTLQGGIPLTVKVIDEESGKILTGATVQLSYADEHATATSDEKGLARFNSLTPAFIYISAALPGYQPVSRVEKDLSSAKAGEEQTEVIKLTEGMKITAYVKDDKGELLPMGYISMDDGDFLPAPTGSRIFTPVKEGKHTFQGRAKKFAETSIFYNAKPKDKSSDKVNLKLLPGATITVEVRNERGELLRGHATKIKLFKNGKSIKTGTGPARMFANLEPGTYSAIANAKTYIGAASREIKYKGDPKAFHDTLKIVLTPKVLMSTLHVLVTAKDDKGNLSHKAAKIKVTGPSGSFTENDMIGNFSDLLPGKYTVTASVTGFKSKTKTLTITSDNPREIYTLSFNLSKDVPNEPKVKKKLPQLNCCNDDTDECITANIINKMNYCREICEGRKAGCYQNCQKNINCGDGSREPAPEKVIPGTIRTIPGNKSSGSSSSMKRQREKNALNNKLNFLIKTNKTNSSEFKSIIQRLKEINK